MLNAAGTIGGTHGGRRPSRLLLLHHPGNIIEVHLPALDSFLDVIVVQENINDIHNAFATLELALR